MVYDNTIGGYVPASVVEPPAMSTGRGWVFFDEVATSSPVVIDSTQEQSSRIIVVGPSSYTVDYFRGAIKNPNIAPTDITYTYNYVSVLDSWPGTDVPPLPVVSIDINKTQKKGFQLGGGKKNIREVYIEIFASSNPERDDITETIHDSLFDKNIAVKDFSYGYYLKSDGTYNTGFVPTTNGYMYILDINVRNINLKTDWSVVNRHRSVITCQYETIVEA